MGKKLQALLQVSVMIARDMLIGLIFGLTTAILLAKINPYTANLAALLIPIGIAAGILKGFTKYLIINIFSSLPSKGYRFNYPKYKLLFLWLGLLLATLFYAYGFNVGTWFITPAEMLVGNAILRNAGKLFWAALIIAVWVIGTASYVYDPPYNNDEVLPPEEDEEQQ